MITDPTRAREFQPGALVELSEYVVAKRQQRINGKIAFANGCFDIIHAGHICMLQTAAFRYGDTVIVGVNTDSGVRKLKGAGRPVMPYADRVLILSSLRYVDAVVGFEDDPYELIATIRPDFLVKGDEYEEDEIIGAELVKATGGQAIRFPMVRDLSSSQLVQRVKEL